jgi:hypothetical protein
MCLFCVSARNGVDRARHLPGQGSCVGLASRIAEEKT